LNYSISNDKIGRIELAESSFRFGPVKLVMPIGPAKINHEICEETIK
jgi:hypothetical protein